MADRRSEKDLPTKSYVSRAMLALRLVWASSQGWTVAWAALLIVQGALPVVVVYLTRDAIDTIAGLVHDGMVGAAWQHALPVVGSLALALLSLELIGRVFTWVQSAQGEKVRDHLTALVHEKATSLDLSYFETPQYYDLLHRVRLEVRNAPTRVLENLGSLIRTGITLAGMSLILVSYAYWLPPVLVLSTLPGLWALLRHTRRYNRWRLKNTTNERLANYYDFLLTERAPAAEVRLFSLAPHYRSAHKTLRDKLRMERLKLDSAKLATDIAATVVAMAAVGGALAWMGWRVVNGLASLGDIAAFLQIFRQGQGLMRTLSGSAGDMYRNVLFLRDLSDFFDLEPRIPSVVKLSDFRPRLTTSVQFDKVSFRYPGSETYALSDFSMTIPAGKIVALVGENGAGKSTLTKLLCRFYDPESGRVLWDGTDLRNLPVDAVQREITMLFQQPYSYNDTASLNIAVGDLASCPSPSKIEASARAAGADEIIRRLPQGYDTLLGKWFGGEELSVGQWQRLALARAILRSASVIVLDEPTSAVDSWAETAWLDRLRDISSGSTVIMITHRFTTAMRADHIIVMNGSGVIEEGTHDHLLGMNGKYAESWHDQMLRQPLSETQEPALPAW
jgi:ATP-binding cassette subfamily B protein